MAANFKIEESIELLRFKENIGVVGTDVVDETDEATEPPCDDEFLKVKVLRFNYGSFLRNFPAKKKILREINSCNDRASKTTLHFGLKPFKPV